MRVTLYTSQDCGLCRRAEALLRHLRREVPFHLELVDIEEHPGLYARYWSRIPVLSIEGREVAEGLLDEARLRDALLGQDCRSLRSYR